MLANMSLSEYFDYKPWDPNYVMTCDRNTATIYQTVASASTAVIENIAMITYDYTTRVGMNEETTPIYVCFIKYSTQFLEQYSNDTIKNGIGSKRYSIIDLTGKYPRYIKDRWCEWATGLQGQPALDIFNADMNKWFKHARYR